MDYGTIALIASLLLAILSGVFGVKYKMYSKKLKQAVELIATIRDAVADKKITDEEVIEIIEKGKALLEPPSKAGSSSGCCGGSIA